MTPFGFEWARTSSRMRAGEWGGGHFVITATEIRGGSTHWLMEQDIACLSASIG